MAASERGDRKAIRNGTAASADHHGRTLMGDTRSTRLGITFALREIISVGAKCGACSAGWEH